MTTEEQLGRKKKQLLSDFLNEYADDPGVLCQILSIYIEETPDRLAQLRESFENKEYAKLGKIAHSFANIFGTLKMTDALQCARDLETATRNNDLGRARELCPILFSHTELSLAEAKSLLQKYS